MLSSLKTSKVCYPFYVQVITRCLLQNDKYCTSFSYFADLFCKLKASEITANYEKQVKDLPVFHEANVQ